MHRQTRDIIPTETAKTLPGLFHERVRRSPHSPAYRSYNSEKDRWEEMTWSEMDREISRWQTALKREQLKTGDRIAIWIANCKEWVMIDQAALRLGLVVVPLYRNDRPENIAFILNDADVKLLLLEDEQYFLQLTAVRNKPKGLRRVVCLQRSENAMHVRRLSYVDDWLPERADIMQDADSSPDDMATIVYTSGTTGNPKGVMLSHRNILWNAFSGLQSVAVFREDIFLSFLPLSHTLERTVGYYLPVMAGSTVAYARSIAKLSEDFLSVRPTVLVSVPRIFERVYAKLKVQLQEKNPAARFLFASAVKVGWQRFAYQQKRSQWTPAMLAWPILDRLVAAKLRNRLGGRLRLSVVGGACLPFEIAKVFISLGIPLLHGYGLTETSPVISVNPLENNMPESVGLLYQDVQARVSKNNELLVKSPGVMLGYWNNPKATGRMIDRHGWIRTGDKAAIQDGRIYITGRIKEIIVMSNGEKIPPTDIETVIEQDPFVEQAIVIGEGKPYLVALLVLNREGEKQLAADLHLNADSPSFLQSERLQEYILDRISDLMRAFPGYAIIRRVALLHDPWTIENGFMTPTLKLRRNNILKYYRDMVSSLYEGHEVFA